MIFSATLLGAQVPISAYLRRGLFPLSLVLAFAGSFAGVLTLTAPRSQDPGNISLRFDSPEYRSPALQSGWGNQRPWGVEMRDTTALIALPIERAFSTDWQLTLIARGRTGSTPSKNIDVYVNGVRVGAFELSPNGADTAQRFSVRSEVLNRQSPVSIKLQHDHASTLTMTLRSILMLEASQLGNKTGQVEVCKQDRIAGYAAAEGVQIVPELRIGGKIVPSTAKTLQRSDLREIGPYTNYGFELRSSEPLAAKTKVHITFPDGTELRNSPCSFN